MGVISVEALNNAFPDYPRTIEDQGWIYGVWYCGTRWKKAILYGSYPATFIDRALALFPFAQQILHVPSGTLNRIKGITVDCVISNGRQPMIQANADCLPFASERFDLIISDPPYSARDAKIYSTPTFPLRGFMKEARRVLKYGGYFCMLHTYYPSYHRKQWKLVGLIAVVTGFQRATRIFSIFQKPMQMDLL